MKLFSSTSGKRASIIKNTVIWILVFVLMALPFGIEIALALILPLIIPVYVNFYLVNKFLKEKKYVSYGILLILLVAVFGIVAHGMSSRVQFTSHSRIDPVGIARQGQDIIRIYEKPVLRFAFNPLIAVLLTTVYKYFQERQQEYISELENQKLRTELAFLKEQVNPHFLFNTLNNLFSMSSTYGDEASADGIGRLSHFLHYMLHETNSEYVLLEHEVDMLENYINLQKLRLAEQTDEHITFKISGDILGKLIPPMLLIPFVENAFKHSYTLEDAFKVDIELSVSKGSIRFEVVNTINRSRKSPENRSSGIGLSNVRRRLDLIFKDMYLLDNKEIDNEYFVTLTIPIKDLHD